MQSVPRHQKFSRYGDLTNSHITSCSTVVSPPVQFALRQNGFSNVIQFHIIPRSLWGRLWGGGKLQFLLAALWIGHDNSVERQVTPTAAVPRRAWNSTNNTYNYVIFRCVGGGGDSPRGFNPNITVKAEALQTRISSPEQVTALSVSPITTQTVQGTSRKQRQGNRQTDRLSDGKSIARTKWEVWREIDANTARNEKH